MIVFFCYGRRAMPRLILTSLAVILLHVWITVSFASEPGRSGVSTSRTEAIRHASLPTDQALRRVEQHLVGDVPPVPEALSGLASVASSRFARSTNGAVVRG